jgi:hypothetical protein
MLIFEILILTLIFYLVLNFSKLRKGIFEGRDLILPLSLGFAVSIVDNFIRTAFIASIFAFIVLFSVCFGVLYFIISPKK